MSVTLSDRTATTLEVTVHPGPALLAGVPDGPGLEAHEARYGRLPEVDVRELVDRVDRVVVRGRGGAGFPFARKVTTAAERLRQPLVVVNLSEGEPASHKDAALATVAPHLVLDGAALTARALGTPDLHVVVPGESPHVGRAIERALSQRRVERRDRRTVRWQVHQAAPRFVAGQAAAVLELMSGRPNLPVTTWRPQAHAGHRGRPTLLSNAETFAQVAQLLMRGEADYLHHGTADEPGTTLLTLDGDLDLSRPPTVVEVPFGTGWDEVLDPDRLRRPVLLGGYHGTWVPEGELARLRVSQPQLRKIGVTLGAGVVLPLDHGCPVDRTARIVGYLASQSAGRCGPCRNGLPVLAGLLGRISSGHGEKGDIDELMRVAGLVERRGACAHPDGTVRLLRSLLAAFGDETRRHAFGGCSHVTPHGGVGAAR